MCIVSEKYLSSKIPLGIFFLQTIFITFYSTLGISQNNISVLYMCFVINCFIADLCENVTADLFEAFDRFTKYTHFAQINSISEH